MGSNQHNTSTDILLYNAKIWVSGEEDYSWLTFSANHKRVTGLGGGESPDTANYEKAYDLNKCRVFPGFHDSHIHVHSVGEGEFSVDLRGCKSIDEMQKRIKTFRDQNPQLERINGHSWEQDLLGRYPTKEDIDAVCPDIPVILERVCFHMLVVNSTMLKIAGVTKDTPDPEGGQIDRYPEGHSLYGELTGLFREASATSYITKHVVLSKTEKIRYIKKGLDVCMKFGLTAVHSNEGEKWHEYCELAKTNELPIRVFMAAYYATRNSGNFPEFAGKSCGDMLSCDRTKLFADGSLGGCTAALSKCYKNQDHKGLLLYPKEDFNHLVKEATCEGFRLEIHIIGDEAADVAITALEKAQVAPEKRTILTHCQILREDLLPRMKKLGVIANIQPQFVTTDARWVPQLLPEELTTWAYAWKSLQDSGIKCAGGSDAPVETPQPLLGIYDAIFRPNGDRNPKTMTTFKPHEKLSVREAVDLYTKAGAYTTFREKDLGQLLPGYIADFVVIDGGIDPVENPELFLTAKISQVWVAGNRVYNRA